MQTQTKIKPLMHLASILSSKVLAVWTKTAKKFKVGLCLSVRAIYYFNRSGIYLCFFLLN